jgi:hypothetical protein
MAETPLFMAENMGALMTLTASVAGLTATPKESLVDNLHYTRYEPAAFAFSTTTEYDQSGLSANATYQGGAPTRGDYFGEVKDGVNFNGSTQYLTLTSKNIGTVHTLECNIDATVAAVMPIYAKDHGAGLYSYLRVDATNIKYNINNGVNNFYVEVAHGGLTAGTGHKFLAVRNSRYVQFYKDGAPLGSLQDLGAAPGAQSFHFDNLCKLSADYYGGKLAKLRVYEFEATAAEIAAQWASGALVSKPIYRAGQFLSACYEMNGAAPYTFTFDPAGTTSVINGIVIDTMMGDPQGHALLLVGGTRYVASIHDWLQKGLYNYEIGRTVLYYSSGMTIATTAIVTVFSATTPKIRHMSPGLFIGIKNPLSPFDPEKVEDIGQQFRGRSGVLVNNTPIYTKKILDASFNRISAAEAVNYQTLYDKAKKKKLPFWFFFRPTTNPRGGYLYNFEEDGWEVPYEEGQYRTCRIYAKADFTPDRSSAAL